MAKGNARKKNEGASNKGTRFVIDTRTIKDFVVVRLYDSVPEDILPSEVVHRYLFAIHEIVRICCEGGIQNYFGLRFTTSKDGYFIIVFVAQDNKGKDRTISILVHKCTMYGIGFRRGGSEIQDYANGGKEFVNQENDWYLLKDDNYSRLFPENDKVKPTNFSTSYTDYKKKKDYKVLKNQVGLEIMFKAAGILSLESRKLWNEAFLSLVIQFLEPSRLACARRTMLQALFRGEILVMETGLFNNWDYLSRLAAGKVAGTSYERMCQVNLSELFCGCWQSDVEEVEEVEEVIEEDRGKKMMKQGE